MSPSIRRFHRLLALPLAVLLLPVLISGVLLNHAEELALDQQPLPDSLSHDLPQPQRVWQLAETTIVHTEAGLWHGRWTPPLQGTVQAYRTPLGVLLVGKTEFLLLDETGGLIVRQRRPDGPLLATWPPAFKTPDGCRQLTLETLAWTPCTDLPTELPRLLPAQASPQQPQWQQALDQWKLKHDQHWGAWLRALHNGRWLGAAGPWLLDALALLLTLMLFSGLRLRQRARRPHRS